MKSLLGASLAPSLMSGKPCWNDVDENARDAKTSILAPFDYRDVRLLNGRLKKQYDATRDHYYNVPNDDILKWFRQRVRLPAPGRDMRGCCQRDAAEVLGQRPSNPGYSHFFSLTEAGTLQNFKKIARWPSLFASVRSGFALRRGR